MIKVLMKHLASVSSFSRLSGVVLIVIFIPQCKYFVQDSSRSACYLLSAVPDFREDCSVFSGSAQPALSDCMPKWGVSECAGFVEMECVFKGQPVHDRTVKWGPEQCQESRLTDQFTTIIFNAQSHAICAWCINDSDRSSDCHVRMFSMNDRAHVASEWLLCFSGFSAARG